MDDKTRTRVATARWVGILLCLGFLVLARTGRPALAEDHPYVVLAVLLGLVAIGVGAAVILFRAVRRDVDRLS